MMKKVLSILLIVALAMSLSVAVFAADQTLGQNGSKEIDVTAKYESSTTTPIVYSVDISWSSMIFTYTQESTKNWNATTHTYDTVTQGAWDKTTASVTVTNHSNTAVDVDVVYTPVAGTGVTGALTNATGTLSSGEEGKHADADALISTLTISGTPTGTVTADGVKVGTLKVTIS